MKNSLLFLSLLCWAGSALLGQNYRAIQPQTESLFAHFYPSNPAVGEEARLKGSVLRNVSPHDSNLYYTFHSWELDTCFTPYGSSWMGDSVRMEGDSLTVFYTREGLPVSLYQQKSPGESWVMYTKGMTGVLANVVRIDTMTILGQLDSVKILQLESFEINTPPPLGEPIDGTEIWLSQSHGLVQTLPWADFPVDTSRYQLTAEQKLTYGEVYDLEVGDLYQTEYEGQQSWSQYTVLNKVFTANPDSIHYLIARESHYSVPGIVNYDTLWQKYSQDFLHTYVDARLPEELFPVGAPKGNTRFYELELAFGGRRFYRPELFYSYQLVPGGLDSCYTATVGEVNEVLYNYVEGIGALLVLYGPQSAYSEERVVYYEKGTDVWGTKLTTAISPSLKDAVALVAGPNPVDDQLQISFRVSKATELYLEWLNLEGKALQRIDFQAYAPGLHELTFPTANLPNGIYLLRVLSPQGQFSQKIWVRH